MPCSDSSSSIAIRLDRNERLISFDFAKITCGRVITAVKNYEEFCRGHTLDEILKFGFSETVAALNLKDEENQYVLYLEWDALRAAIAEYLGADIDGIDRERCKIASVVHDEEGIEISEVILPPKELPKILPCSLANN